MSAVRQYSIVDVPLPNGDIAVTVVPNKWICDGEMLCPSDAKKEAAASKAYADPDESFSLKECTVRRTYNSYEEARKMLPLAYETDGLLSEKELGRSKRKRKKKEVFTFSESDGETDPPVEKKSRPLKSNQRQSAQKQLPPPPEVHSQSSGADNLISLLKKKKMQESSSTKGGHPHLHPAANKKSDHPQITKDLQSTVTKVTIKPPTIPVDVFVAKQSDAKDSADIQSTVTNEAKSKPPTKTVMTQAKKQAQNKEDSGPTHFETHNYDHGDFGSSDFINDHPGGTDYSDHDSGREMSLYSEGDSENEDDDSNDERNQSSQRSKVYCDGDVASKQTHYKTAASQSNTSSATVVHKKMSSKPSALHSKDQAAIIRRMLVKQQLILTKQVEMEHKLDLILGYVGAGEGASKPEGWPEEFPMKTMLQLLEFESALKETEVYDFAARHFSVVVGMGCDAATMATEICKKLFHNDLASELNWQGSETKRGIKKMKIGQLILEAVAKRYEGKFKTSSVTGAISSWLRNRA